MKQLAIASIGLAACGGLDHHAVLPETSAPPRSAGNVGMNIAPDRDAAAIAVLRARGRSALDELLATYDTMPAGPVRAALAATIDQVAAQRYATVSRLYWYTDLAAAEAEAKATGKPILSLRMLGRLDEDLSCANSRFFRTILYPDPTISAVLRDKFVLHWSSERAVPRVTIDFGDGRTIERTVTGNSIHYILDADGNVIDALPGLYAPAVFAGELDKALGIAKKLNRAEPGDRAAILADYHRHRTEALDARWAELGGSILYDVGADRILFGDGATASLALAQRATMSKARIEAPQLAKIDIGPDPGALMPDVNTWALIGRAVFGLDPTSTAASSPEPASWDMGAQAVVARRKTKAGAYTLGTAKNANANANAATTEPSLLSAPARTLIGQVLNGSGADPAQVLPELERSLIADTAINELVLRRQVVARILDDSGDHSLAAVNRYVYDNIFHTPAGDQWLGLVSDDVYSGLPADGIVIRR